MTRGHVLGCSKQNKVGKSTPEFAGSDSKRTGFRA
jgi:hypothetical protein